MRHGTMRCRFGRYSIHVNTHTRIALAAVAIVAVAGAVAILRVTRTETPATAPDTVSSYATSISRRSSNPAHLLHSPHCDFATCSNRCLALLGAEIRP